MIPPNESHPPVSAWLRSHEIVVLLAVLVVVGGIWAFIEIAGEVRQQDRRVLEFDKDFIKRMRREDDPSTPIGPRWLQEAGRDMTAMGGVTILTLATLAVAGFLLIRGKHHAMWFVLAATAGGLILSLVLKRSFSRPRPDVVPHLSLVDSSSFPSGHSMMSAVVYLTLGSLLARLVDKWRLRLYCIGIALLATLLVGVSRIYMGVHYPTDVLAGWTAGLAWASLCWLAARWLQQRGAVEESAEVT